MPAAASPKPGEAVFDREAWLRDYAGLKEAIARGYANLDWMVAQRRLDLPALDRATTERLEAATSVKQAVAAISAFTEAFGDNHLRGAQGPAPEAALRNAAAEAAEADALQAIEEPRSQDCDALGYEDAPRLGAFDPADLPGWQRVASPYFTAGTSGRSGVIRIHSFDETAYLAACRASWQAARTPRETQLATREALQAELSRLAAALRGAGAETLAIDLTGNGGGSEWSEDAAALFSDRELTRPTPRLIEEHCDRSGVWRGESVCSNLSPPGGIDRLAGKAAWAGPVVVLVGNRTASAAEDFAYWLRGSGVARLLGERTFGAGCGYMDGGRAYQFRAIDGHVMMPNCSRYTFEGINQVEGLKPDVTWDWSGGPPDLDATLER